VKPWVFRRGHRKEGRPKALALKAFSTFDFLGLVFLGYRLSTLVKERHELSFVKPWVVPPWPKGKGPAKSPVSKSIFNLCLSGTCVFLGYRLSTLVEERHELSFVKPWLFRRGPREKGQPKALALRAFSTFVFFGLVFFGISYINAGKRKTRVFLCEAMGYSAVAQGKRASQKHWL
jgi:hypothetical protein